MEPHPSWARVGQPRRNPSSSGLGCWLVRPHKGRAAEVAEARLEKPTHGRGASSCGWRCSCCFDLQHIPLFFFTLSCEEVLSLARFLALLTWGPFFPTCQVRAVKVLCQLPRVFSSSAPSSSSPPQPPAPDSSVRESEDMPVRAPERRSEDMPEKLLQHMPKILSD